MKSRIGMIICIYLANTGILFAQEWSKKDSTWLRKILSGDEEIRLNPEFQKSIDAGTFIRTDESINQLLSAPPILPITKEFRNIKPRDSVNQNILIDSISPQVLMRMPVDSIPEVKANLSLPPKEIWEQEEFRIKNTPFAVGVSAANLLPEEVKDGQKRGTLNGKVKMNFSLEDILLSIFSKEERNKKRNRKKARAWKSYNQQPL